MAAGGKFKRGLRARAHHLQVVVQIGHAGLSHPVLAEVERALDAHELIKIRIAVGDRADRARIVALLCTQTGAALVQSIGRVIVLYRRRETEC